MKKLWQFLLIGLFVALAGLLLSDPLANFFNGMDYGSAAVLALGLYLCVVIVTCTSLILAKLDQLLSRIESNSASKH